MALNSMTGRRPAPADPAAGSAPVARGGRDVWEWVWNLLTSMRLGVFLILIMAVLGLFGTLITQAPTGVLEDPQSRQDFLAGVRPRFGGWTDVFATLGLFNVFGSIWFKSIVAVLASSLVACSANRVHGIVKVARDTRVAVGEPFFKHAPHHDAFEVAGDRAALTATVVATMKKHGLRPTLEDDGVVHVYADKFRWTPMASVMAHLSLVVILAGVVVGGYFGYRDESFMVSEGQTLAVPSQAAPDMTVKLLSFTSSYYTDNGAPSDYASDVVVMQGGKEIAHQTIRVNTPLKIGDLSFYQSFYGASALMSVKDQAGTELYSGGVPLAWTADDDRKVGTFTIPGKNITVWVVGTLGGDDTLVKPGQMRIELYDGSTGDPIVQQTLDQGTPAIVNGLTFAFARETEFTGLAVARDPGNGLVWLGALLLAGGFMAVFFLPIRRVWARMVVGPDGRGVLQLAAPLNNHFGADQAYASLVTDLKAACASPLNA